MIIVGDVHGCLAELRELLAECEFLAGTDTLVFVGDLVNKGPSSAEVRGRGHRSCCRDTRVFLAKHVVYGHCMSICVCCLLASKYILHRHPTTAFQQVVKEARRLNAFCVRGNHDDSALAAYHAKQRGEDVDVRLNSLALFAHWSTTDKVLATFRCQACCSMLQIGPVALHVHNHATCAPAERRLQSCQSATWQALQLHGLLCSELVPRSCSNSHLHLQAKYAWATGLSAEDAAWMAELPFTLSIPSRRIIVAHAGVLPGVPLPQQSLADLYTVHDTSSSSCLFIDCIACNCCSPSRPHLIQHSPLPRAAFVPVSDAHLPLLHVTLCMQEPL